jgi:hypothetical protein
MRSRVLDTIVDTAWSFVFAIIATIACTAISAGIVGGFGYAAWWWLR